MVPLLPSAHAGAQAERLPGRQGQDEAMHGRAQGDRQEAPGDDAPEGGKWGRVGREKAKNDFFWFYFKKNKAFRGGKQRRKKVNCI